MKATKILTIPALLSALTASAQYNPTVEVEGTYKPEVILQDRVNTFPERLRLGNTDSRLDYDMDGVVTDFAPLGVPMPATGWNDTRAPAISRICRTAAQHAPRRHSQCRIPVR